MSIKLTRTFTRPSLAVEFWRAPAETKTYIEDNYVKTEKLLSVDRGIIDDSSLTSTIVYVFARITAFDEFIADANLAAVVHERNTYLAANGIANDYVVEEIAD